MDKPMNKPSRNPPMRESMRKLVNLELARQKRAKLNELINKEIRIRDGATNMLNACHNEESQQRLRLELAFVDSNIKYLKDQLAEVNCDWTMRKVKNYAIKSKVDSVVSSTVIDSAFSSMSSRATSDQKSPATLSGDECVMEELVIPIQIGPKSVATTNSYSISPSSSCCSSSIHSDNLRENSLAESLNQFSFTNSKSGNFLVHLEKTLNAKLRLKLEEDYSLDEFFIKSNEIMIYLNAKETFNKLDFMTGFRNFISKHYHDDCNKYTENIKQFNLYRQLTLGLSYEPNQISICHLFEYYNALYSIEKRFFQDSQCDGVFFTWYDSINGIESSQKSIQFERASVIFNCSALYSQLAGICYDGKPEKLNEQMSYWQKAAGCLVYLTKNFSNSPTPDMNPCLVNLFVEIFMCQAYETKCKLSLTEFRDNNVKYDFNSAKNLFTTYATCARVFSYISEKYKEISQTILNNSMIKSYLPEIWLYLIKIKSCYFKSLAHYYTSMGIGLKNLDNFWNDVELTRMFEELHDKTKITSRLATETDQMFSPLDRKENGFTHQSYYQIKILEQRFYYSGRVLKGEKRFNLAKAHVKESINCIEEAIRQHGFCRKFSKEDNLFNLLQSLHDIELDKLVSLDDKITSEFDLDSFDLFPINHNMPEESQLKPIEPSLNQFEYRDYFFSLGPMRVFTSENEISEPFSCVLKKHPSQQNYGIILKGDCPARVSHVDRNSCAYNAGIREGDYLIAIQDLDVKWAKHAQVVEAIRSMDTIVKLTLIKVKHIAKEMAIFCDEGENNNIKKCSDQSDSSVRTVNESNLWKIMSNNNETIASKPKSLRIKECLQKWTKSNMNLSEETSNWMLTNAAATKLCHLAQSQSNQFGAQDTLLKTSGENGLGHKFKSMSNLYHLAEKFQSSHDLSHKLSSTHASINTITLGRRFKKNVMKLSIFNVFNGATKESGDVKETDSCQLSMKDESKSSWTGIKPTKIRVLKKQKKLKKLERMCAATGADLPNENQDLIYKTL